MRQRKSRTLINILGAGRSGTTMLDLMLGSDDEAFSLGEVHAWFRPFRVHHRSIDCNCGNAQCPYWTKILSVPEQEFHANAFEKLGVEFLIDSSKSLTWVIDNNRWMNERGINVVNLVIHKPLTSYVYSIWKRGESIDAALYRYRVYYSRLSHLGMPVLAISFLDLINDPDKCLKKICKITGQSYTERRKEFWRCNHHHIFGSGGVRKQSQVGSSRIQGEESYPEEFLVLMNKVAQKIRTDKRFRDIKEFLSDHDLNESNWLYSIDKAGADFSKPGWYYAAKAKSLWRRRFPEKYKQ